MTTRDTIPHLGEPHAVRPPHITHEPARDDGTPALMRCPCGRRVQPWELLDFRALSPAQRSALGLARDIECSACFHHRAATGELLLAAVGTALGLAAHVVASYDHHDRHSAAMQLSGVGPANAHLHDPAHVDRMRGHGRPPGQG